MSRYRRARTDGGTFFFTVALARRDQYLLVEYIDRLRFSYQTVAQTQPFSTIAICVLPDHLHAIWQLPEQDEDFSTRWARIKTGFSRGSPVAPDRSQSKISKREKGIWQRRFWEHQIRDEEGLRRHIDYIHYNPIKHGLVTQLRDWPYSSFHKLVHSGDLPEDWAGSSDDGSFGERV